jgi:hypothetical protein
MAFKFHAQGALNLMEANRKREEKRQERILNVRASALENYLSSKKTQTENSALVAAKLKNISKYLPEDSPIIDQLAGADSKTVAALEKEVLANRKFYEENNLTYSPEMLEGDLDVVRVEVENDPDLDLVNLYKDMFRLTEEDLASETGGITLKEMLEMPQTSDIGVTYSIKSPPGLDDPGKLKEFKSAYQAELRPFINQRIRVNENKIRNQDPDMIAAQDENDRLEQALEALKGDFPDYSTAAQLAGPEPAIELMETFPQYKNFSLYINKGLSFPDNNEGQQLLVRAIKSGLLKAGDTFTIIKKEGDTTVPILEILTEDQVNSALGS